MQRSGAISSSWPAVDSSVAAGAEERGFRVSPIGAPKSLHEPGDGAAVGAAGQNPPEACSRVRFPSRRVRARYLQPPREDATPAFDTSGFIDPIEISHPSGRRVSRVRRSRRNRGADASCRSELHYPSGAARRRCPVGMGHQAGCWVQCDVQSPEIRHLGWFRCDKRKTKRRHASARRTG